MCPGEARKQLSVEPGWVSDVTVGRRRERKAACSLQAAYGCYGNNGSKTGKGKTNQPCRMRKEQVSLLRKYTHLRVCSCSAPVVDFPQIEQRQVAEKSSTAADHFRSKGTGGPPGLTGGVHLYGSAAQWLHWWPWTRKNWAPILLSVIQEAPCLD